METVTAAGVPRNGLPVLRSYRWRDPARGADAAELEKLRKTLDRQAGYHGEQEWRQAPKPDAAPAAAEPAPPAPPAERCRACRYLTSSIGHKVKCG
jgi:hypothetical protein